jgi:hypothetical protein
MDVPIIDSQVRRDVGAAAVATDFGSVHWAVREGDPAGAEQTIGLTVFDAGKRTLSTSTLTAKKWSTSSMARSSTRSVANRRDSARATSSSCRAASGTV